MTADEDRQEGNVHIDYVWYECGLFCFIWTPLAATFFSMEVISVGVFYYSALVPCLCGSLVAFFTAQALGCSRFTYSVGRVMTINVNNFVYLLGLSLGVAIVSILFVRLMHYSYKVFHKYFENPYIRVVVGSVLLLVLVLIFGKDYLGTGMDVVDAVKKYAGVDWNEVKDVEQAKALAKEHHIEFEDHHKKGDILNLFFEEYVEEHLVQPTFIMDHPIEISPLTKKKPENPEYVERLEFFMNGWEMANAYSELNDPIDQRERFKAQEELLVAGDEEANTKDEDFLNVLEIGMPPTGGIDRMVMLLTDSAAIRDVLLFPTMKKLDK